LPRPIPSRFRRENGLSERSTLFLVLACPVALCCVGCQFGCQFFASASRQIHQGVDAYRATGASFQLPHFLVPVAEAARVRGRPEEGLDVLADAMAIVENTGERYLEAELHRLQGELLLDRSPGDHGPAEGAFQKALSVARAQQAKSLELRAATSLARLWQAQDKTTAARDLLAPVYQSFSEGFDTPDLKSANALLDELS
jgi:predicted ATPase